jgi:CRP-like cAMP-binding protein
MALAQIKSQLTNTLAMAQIARLTPFDKLDPERQAELRKHLHVENLPAGTRLFSRGEVSDKVVYLLAGEIELIVNQARTIISAAASQARQPIDPHQPRHFTAITKTPVQIVQIDRSLLDIFVSWDNRTGYSVKEINELTSNSDDNDWMTSILQTKIFQRVPPINIQIMFTKLQSIPVRKGEIIFRQDQEGDFFYLIKSGQCAVLRIRDPEEGLRLIAELGPGQGFGEEALLSEKPRNATIQMLSDGALLRLSRSDFNELLKTPVVKTVSYQNALELIEHGAMWLDVRGNDEHAKGAIPDSIHIPLPMLRDCVNTLPTDHPFIVYCNNGQRSACAAYLLHVFGYEALVLDSGLQNTPTGLG